MKSKYLKYAAMICAGAVLSACASSTVKSDRLADLLSDPRVGDSVENVCFNGGLAGFSDNTRDSVVLQKNSSESYLLTVRSCPLLAEAESVEPLVTGNCLRLMDDLTVKARRDDFMKMSPSYCSVDGIYEWNMTAK